MAINFDAAADVLSLASSTATFSHTCSGSNRILFVSLMHGSGTSDRVSGVTYNSVAMTRINRATSSNEPCYLYYLIAPDTGANNVVVTLNTATTCRACSSSYTGALQSGVPDSSGTNTQESGNSIQKAITTVLDNCWLVYGVSLADGTAATATGSGAVRAQETENCIGDSNGAKTPAGSYSGGASWTTSSDACMVIASFAPALAATGHTRFLPLLGVG